MIIADIGVQALREGAEPGEPRLGVRLRPGGPGRDGSLDSQVLYVVLEPRKSGGRHAHSAEEILFVAEGTPS